MTIAYVLQNGQKLDERSFCRYLSKKIEKTQKNFNIKSRTNKVYCLDDAAIDVVYGLMKNKKIKLKKSIFLFCLRKELEIFAKLKKTKLDFIEYNGLKSNISQMLDELEKRHKEIKYSILKAQLQEVSLF